MKQKNLLVLKKKELKKIINLKEELFIINFFKIQQEHAQVMR